MKCLANYLKHFIQLNTEYITEINPIIPTAIATLPTSRTPNAGIAAAKPITAKVKPIQLEIADQLTCAPIASKYAPAEAKDSISIQPYPRIAKGPNHANINRAAIAKTKAAIP
jgi:hypothetical protein